MGDYYAHIITDMKSPIALSLLEKMATEELAALQENVQELLSERVDEHSQSVGVQAVNNLFALIREKKIKEGDIRLAWGGTYKTWTNYREKINRISVEKVYQLARLAQVPPSQLFRLILNSYPQQDGQINFDAYRPQAQQDLEDIKILKK